MSFTIVSDTASDIPSDMQEKYNIEVVQTSIIMEERVYLNDDISVDQLLSSFKRGKVATTSQPTPELFLATYLKALEKSPNNEVLAIHISSKLSGLFSVAKFTADTIESGRIELFDTGNISFASGYFVYVAARLRELGHSLDVVKDCLERIKDMVYLQVLVDDVSYLMRSGRVRLALFYLLRLFNLKPVIRNKNGLMVGDGISIGRTLGLRKVSQRAHSYQLAGDFPIYIFGHVNDKQILLKMSRDFEPNSSEIITLRAGPTLVSHVGPHAVGIIVAPGIDWIVKRLL